MCIRDSRDLKPANVLLTNDGTAKLCDFGLARTLEGTRAHVQATGVCGTAVYMAPEVWEEEPLTDKADVYAYGIVVNELETRARPWEAARSAMAIGRKVTQGKRPEPAAGGAVGVLIGRCWANKPLERPCMIQVLAELRTL